MNMTDYESEIYTILLENGVCTAKKISELGNVPVTRVYEILKEMEENGLVSTMETRPKKYKIFSLDGLKNLIKNKRRKMESEITRAEETFKKIKEEAPKPNHNDDEKETGEFWFVRGRQIGSCSENEIIKQNTKNELLQFSGDLSWVPEQFDLLKGLIDEETNMKVLCHKHRASKERIEMLESLGAEVCGWENGYVRGKIMDGKKALLIFKVPRSGVDEEAHTGVPGNEKLFKYDRIITSNPKFVKMMKRYFDFFWNQKD
ncbi:MAG: TrmB family transcriptional regulator [Candidatus Aenigmatarchaeota archaeon]